MTELTLTLACWDYDRTRPLLDGRVALPGVRFEATVETPSEIFARAFTEAPFDVSELSLSSYMMQVARGACEYVAIPAFVSRAFRHGGIYVAADSGIEAPRDLEGRRVGVPEYQMTMALWARGLLHDEYGVDVGTLRWRTGGTNKPGRAERLPLELPEGIEVVPIGRAETLNGLLLAGGVDAVIAPEPPAAFSAGDPAVRRLIADPVAAERAYYAKTGLFPIMHVVGLRRSLADAHPGLAGALYRAFDDARRLALDDLRVTARASANRLSLPWAAAEWEATTALMGDDFWTYGVARNRSAIETACRYSLEQHLSGRLLGPDDLFHPETLAT